jgi:hypothetical protein
MYAGNLDSMCAVAGKRLGAHSRAIDFNRADHPTTPVPFQILPRWTQKLCSTGDTLHVSPFGTKLRGVGTDAGTRSKWRLS